VKIIFSLHNTKRKLLCVFIPALIISFCIPPTNVLADTGPNPKMDFEIQYNIASVYVESAKLMFCEDLDCKVSQEVLGPFWCDQNSCSYRYGGNGYYKLVITCSDKTRESNVFQKTRFNSSYTVIVNQDGLQVTENWSGLPYEPGSQIKVFLIALAITVPIELLVAGIFLKIQKQPYKAIIIITANLITLPIVWFLFPFIRLDGFAVIFLGEIFALLFETWYIKKNYENMSYVTSFWLSLSMNLSSFLIPILLFMNGYIPGIPMY